MRNKTKGVVAGLAGLALLAGGTTFALWSDTATVDGGDITSGNLDVAATDEVAWWDVSPDRVDAVGTAPLTGTAGHAITDADTWRIVPGDVVQGSFGVAVALEGDNLVATLGLANPTAIADAGGTIQSIAVYAPDGTPLTSTSAGGVTTVRLQASGTGQAAGVDDPDAIVITDTEIAAPPVANLFVVVTLSFAADGRDDVQTTVVDLSSVGVTLTQVRAGAGFAGIP